MSRKPPAEFSRRERQIMEIVYARGEASAAQVLESLPDPPSYSAVRALLAILVQKGQLKRRSEQGRYIYSPTRPRAKAGRSAFGPRTGGSDEDMTAMVNTVFPSTGLQVRTAERRRVS